MVNRRDLLEFGLAWWLVKETKENQNDINRVDKKITVNDIKDKELKKEVKNLKKELKTLKKEREKQRKKIEEEKKRLEEERKNKEIEQLKLEIERLKNRI